jgi:two-component system response regulator TctD
MSTMAPIRLLLVEDTPEIALSLAAALRHAGHVVDLAADGAQAQALLQPGHAYAAVLLDLSLPDTDGLTLLQGWRAAGDTVPVLVLTARASVPDRVLGLNLGADDYLPKPFDLAELEARLQALLRRPGRAPAPMLRLGPLQLEAQGQTARWGEQALALTPREFAALRVLLQQAGRTVSKEHLHREVFADEDVGLEAVEVLIFRLRRKLEAQGPDLAIVTFRGMGYSLALRGGTA